jgi:hypothetical protein
VIKFYSEPFFAFQYFAYSHTILAIYLRFWDHLSLLEDSTNIRGTAKKVLDFLLIKKKDSS